MSKIQTFRVISAEYVRRTARFLALVSTLVFVLLLVLIVLLAIVVNPWWLVLIVPWVILGGIALIVVVLLFSIAHIFFPAPLTPNQAVAVTQFLNTVDNVVGTTTLPRPLLVASVVRDAIFKRDLVTLKNYIRQSTALKNDFISLEKLFNGSLAS